MLRAFRGVLGMPGVTRFLGGFRCFLEASVLSLFLLRFRFGVLGGLSFSFPSLVCLFNAGLQGFKRFSALLGASNRSPNRHLNISLKGSIPGKGVGLRKVYVS